ncbi:MAG: LysM peptidoglycan-binding domain-containing protein [Actinomycetota bacterium]|nr:LysM peptidoglycan-binding domain-containing protein [Actinomycetota bacterium]
MQPRSRARYLAPIALAAALAGTYLVVHSGVTARQPNVHHVRRSGRPHGRFAQRRFYAVQAGENLTSIATKTGIPLGQLETLNPSADPNALQTGQRLRLRQ